jgi:hypothetical protein
MESASDGLETGGNARIELAEFCAQLPRMAPATIRNRRPRPFRREADLWLARAVRARQIAMTLSKGDAETTLAYAAECEAEAARLAKPQHQAARAA